MPHGERSSQNVVGRGETGKQGTEQFLRSHMLCILLRHTRAVGYKSASWQRHLRLLELGRAQVLAELRFLLDAHTSFRIFLRHRGSRRGAGFRSRSVRRIIAVLRGLRAVRSRVGRRRRVHITHSTRSASGLLARSIALQWRGSVALLPMRRRAPFIYTSTSW